MKVFLNALIAFAKNYTFKAWEDSNKFLFQNLSEAKFIMGIKLDISVIILYRVDEVNIVSMSISSIC